MAQEFEKKEITKKSEDFSRWYTDVILKAELADYAPVRGCQVFRPYGFAIWENIQEILDKKIKEAGVKNAYFPLFIPYSFLEKEKEHVKGFSPELAVVTHGGGKKLAEPLVIRPTSETVMYEMFSKWIKSWRDLPLLINQWCNIVRWEKRTYLFLRTIEFLWQEGHTCHRSHKLAKTEARRALRMYQDFYENFLAIPGITGEKPESDKFAGALDTFAYEMLMPDGKVLQGCTAHDLGQNFAKPFDIVFQDKDRKQKYVWQTSWGLSTRAIGALIMVHGDDLGLIFPPKIAPIQVVVIPIFEKKNKKKILSFSKKIKRALERTKIRVKLDDREKYTPGWKFNEWELKGVPLRLEIGTQEIEDNFVTAVRRDDGERSKFKNRELKIKIKELLDEIQNNLYERAKRFLEENTYYVEDYGQFKRIMKEKRGFIKAFWCEDSECESKIKEETKASIRLLPLDAKEKEGKCIYCGREAKHLWLSAQAY